MTFPGNLLRRKYRIFLLILVTGIVYLCFQLLSFKVLNFTSKQDMKYKSLHSAVVFDDPQQEPKQDKSKNKYSKDSKLKSDLPKNPILDEDNGESDSKLNILRGIHITHVEEYKPDSEGRFQCRTSKKLIPYSSVNDDYCDCDDSSDEPGTSACPDSRFYCTFQNADVEPQYVLGSRVNDGVCDCCDGSDEWAGISVFSGVHLTDKRMRGSLTHAPCKDTCKAALKINEEDAQIRAFGKRLKQTYIEKAKGISNPENLYGPDGVYYKLSLDCFDYDAPEYKYRLCPFKSVTQQKFNQASVNLGKTPVWRTRLPGHYILKMDRGDVSGCPFGHVRNTVITFLCGLTDKIVHVSEDERCTYSMKFATPAAC